MTKITQRSRIATLGVAVLLVATIYIALALAQEEMPLPDLLGHVHGLSADAQVPDRLILATHHGLWSVDTAKARATLIGESRDDFMGFSTHPAQPGRFHASGHPAQGGNLGVIGSEDGGLTWQLLGTGANGPVDFHQMEVSRADPRTLYGIHHGTSLQRSDDGGVTWRVIGPAPEGVIDIATSAASVDGLFAATRTGLLRSQDGGVTWQPVHPTAGPVSLIDVDVDGTVHAFVLGQGLIRTDEVGLDWQVLSNGFGDDYILHFARVPGVSDRLFAVTGKGALQVSDDAGITWEVIAQP